ncbi:hypothetical protein CCAX7_54290 [Capsulimonas corticalis]|uniref:Uncharacterized protein n=1 Tax=Capsulimonas corticalis TaxID=2219043 RepID=A0A402CNL3_9BACT|nr:hypothetical protein [Capsulimonas corticalis]BDI33378.1 hypothetical protein CCAX7_54290 [Capsulimonas corticalis]
MWTGQETANVLLAAGTLVTAIGGVIKIIELSGRVKTSDAKADAAVAATSDLRGTADQHDQQITGISSRVGAVEAVVDVTGKLEDMITAVKAAGNPASESNVPATPPATDTVLASADAPPVSP